MRMPLRFQQSERCLLLHLFRTSPAGADHIDARAVTVDTMAIMAPATMAITGTMDLACMLDLATATMVGGGGSGSSLAELDLKKRGRNHAERPRPL
jgi:hypothetical protein